MLKYIVLGKWTDEGRRTLDDIKTRIETAKNLIEGLNSSLSLCFTMGEYDFVGIVDVPDEETMVTIALKLNKMQKFSTTTLRAWPDTEFIKLVSKL